MGVAPEGKEGQRKPILALRRRLLDLATHPRIPEGASLTGLAVLVGLAEFLRRSAEEDHEWFPVLNRAGELTGVITAQDVRKALDRGDLQARVGTLATREVVAVSPEHSLQDVVARFHVRDLGHLPVVDPGNPKKLIGIISRRHLIRAYNEALVKKHLLRPGHGRP